MNPTPLTRTRPVWIGAPNLRRWLALALLSLVITGCSQPNPREANTPHPSLDTHAPGAAEQVNASTPDATDSADSEASPPAADLDTPATTGERGHTLVAGSGPCERDADCLPAACCQPRLCVDKAHAPACQQPDASFEDLQVCPAVVGPMDALGAGCLCHEGRCSSLVGSASIEGSSTND